MYLKNIHNQFRKKTLTAVKLVEQSLALIDEHDSNYNAVAETTGDAIETARALDKEWNHSGPKSPLHGIPILIKDNINTTDGLLTTAGSLALSDLNAPYEATLVKNLRKAGAIILGKTNLSEFAYFMHRPGMPSGYSSRKGQVKNPYGKLDPLGSSTGSAVAMASGYTPVAIGTETSGSLMAPAYHTSTVAIKPTVGLVSRYGIIPVSPVQDTPGPMARTVEDAALLLEAMKGLDVDDEATLKVPSWSINYANAIHAPIKYKTLGFIEFEGSPLSEVDQKLKEELIQIFHQEGLTIKTLTVPRAPLDVIESMIIEFKNGLNQYLKTVKGFTAMNSLKDIIAFNSKHPETCLKYGQSLLEEAQAIKHTLKSKEYLKIRAKVDAQASVFTSLYETEGLDAMVSLEWNAYGPALGHPSVVVPAKSLKDLIPKSMVFMGPAWSEETLIALAHHYEIKTQRFIAPF